MYDPGFNKRLAIRAYMRLPSYFGNVFTTQTTPHSLAVVACTHKLGIMK